MTPAVWFTPWLRRWHIRRLREQHIARWGYAVGDRVWAWCGRCGRDHTVVVKAIRATRATVSTTCPHFKTDVDTRFLRQLDRV